MCLEFGAHCCTVVYWTFTLQTSHETLAILALCSLEYKLYAVLHGYLSLASFSARNLILVGSVLRKAPSSCCNIRDWTINQIPNHHKHFMVQGEFYRGIKTSSETQCLDKTKIYLIQFPFLFCSNESAMIQVK